MSRDFWSDSEVEALRAHAELRTRPREIARQLGRSVDAVYGQARRLGLQLTDGRSEPKPRADAGSSYINPPEDGWFWETFTAERLQFLYPDQDRSALTARDVARWNRLGKGRDAA